MSVTGGLILGVFATIWWIVGLRIAGHGAALVYPLPVLAALLLGSAAWRLSRRQRGAPGGAAHVAEQARQDRLVTWASVAEGLVIFVIAGIVLPTTGHREATVSAIALIVGVHFVPLAWGLPAPRYYVTAAALIFLGLVGFAIDDRSARITLVSAGAAVVLWLMAAAVLRGLARPRPSDELRRGRPDPAPHGLRGGGAASEEVPAETGTAEPRNP